MFYKIVRLYLVLSFFVFTLGTVSERIFFKFLLESQSDYLYELRVLDLGLWSSDFINDISVTYNYNSYRSKLLTSIFLYSTFTKLYGVLNTDLYDLF